MQNTKTLFVSGMLFRNDLKFLPSVSWIASSHHVLSIKHLLGQFWYSQRSVLLATTGCQWGKSGHEKVKPGEGDHVDCQFSQICVQLTGEPQASGDT